MMNCRSVQSKRSKLEMETNTRLLVVFSFLFIFAFTTYFLLLTFGFSQKD